ncbi:MAG: hypothetical protein WCO57_16895 [Verrucomicrobiota bacterium]
MTTSKKLDLATLTPQARKTYQAGLAIVAAKLRGHHRLTAAEREAACLAAGLVTVKHTLATARQAKTLAAPARPTPAKPPASVKTFGTPGVRTLKRYACRGGLFG